MSDKEFETRGNRIFRLTGMFLLAPALLYLFIHENTSMSDCIDGAKIANHFGVCETEYGYEVNTNQGSFDFSQDDVCTLDRAYLEKEQALLEKRGDKKLRITIVSQTEVEKSYDLDGVIYYRNGFVKEEC